MAVSSISSVTPARITVLCVPLQSIRKSKFDVFVERLRPETIVRLGDISPDGRPDRNMFSPLAFPNGVMLFDFLTSRPPETHVRLAPFELFREVSIVLALADGADSSVTGLSTGSYDPNSDINIPDYWSRIRDETAQLRQSFPGALLVEPLVFNIATSSQGNQKVSDILTVPPIDQSRSTTIKTVMCDIAGKFLSEMAVYARSIQTSEAINSPGTSTSRASTNPNGISSGNAEQQGPKLDRGRVEERNSAEGIRGPETQGQTLRRASTASLAPAFQRRERSKSPADQSRPMSMMVNGSNLDLRERTLDNRPMSNGIDSRSGEIDRRQTPTQMNNTLERTRNQLKTRQGLIIGTMYLRAGRWSDALRELVDNATRAKVFGDNLWYAKGLENILATMLMLAWAGIDFVLPPICYPATGKSNPGRGFSSSNLVRTSQSTDSHETNARAMLNLSAALPDMVQMIVSAYRQSPHIGGEVVPQYPFSQLVVRLAYTLSLLQRSGGQLNKRTLSHLVSGSKLPKASQSPPKTAPGVGSRDISSLVFEALPDGLSPSSMSLVDLISILSDMAFVLSSARLFRKQALLVRETLSVLIPSLIQARKVGAAEMGIHPAASLAARHGLGTDTASGTPQLGRGEIERGFHNLLVALCQTYGVVVVAENSFGRNARLVGNKAVLQASPSERIVADALARSFGGFGLKTDVLRLCANFSEALPNFQDVVQFTSALLTTAGPGSAPSQVTDRVVISLAPEDQVRFATKIHRTLSVFKAIDAAKLETDYWDHFLVRDVGLVQTVGPAFLVSRPRSELAATQRNVVAAASVPDPFLHNAFAKSATILQADTMVAGETAEFLISLQNLYDIEIFIENLGLVTEGVNVTFQRQTFFLGPRRRQQIVLRGTPDTSGQITVVGCKVKIQGCLERLFPIFAEDWLPAAESKVKTSGLSALPLDDTRPVSTHSQASLETNSSLRGSDPVPVTRTFKVIGPQPVLSVALKSMSQTVLDIYEGETRVVDVELRNTSETATVDFLRLSFGHSSNGQSRSDSNRDETYTSGDGVPVIRWLDNSSESLKIAPASIVHVKFELVGHAALTDIVLTVNYASVAGAQDDAAGTTFYSRHVALPLRVSVEPSVQLEKYEILPRMRVDKRHSSATDEAEYDHGTFSLIMDLRNRTALPLELSVAGAEPGFGEGTQVQVQGGDLQRTALNVKKLLSGNTSQEENEGDRDGILLRKQLRGEWLEATSGRRGRIDLGAIKVDRTKQRMVRSSPVSIKLKTSEARIGQPITLTATVESTSLLRETLIRFKPRSLDEPSLSTPLDLSRRLVWTGPLRRPLLDSRGDNSRVQALGLCALVPGRYEVLVSLEAAGSTRNSEGPGAPIQAPDRDGTQSRKLAEARIVLLIKG